MSIIVHKQVQHDHIGNTNNTQLEEMYQLINIIKLDEQNPIPQEEIKRKMDSNYGKFS